MIQIACFLLGVFSLTNCSEPKSPPTVAPPPQPSLEPSAQPASQPSGAIEVPGPPVEPDTSTASSPIANGGDFEGSAEVKLGKNRSLSRTVAANRARADLANQLRAAGQLAKDAPLPEGVSVELEVVGKKVRARARLP